MLVIGMSSSDELRSPRTSFGMRAPSPLPNPLRRATTHLLGQLPIGQGATGRGVKHDDRLTERGSLGQAHRPRDDTPADPVAEMQSDLLDDLLGQAGSGVIH